MYKTSPKANAVVNLVSASLCTNIGKKPRRALWERADLWIYSVHQKDGLEALRFEKKIENLGVWENEGLIRD